MYPPPRKKVVDLGSIYHSLMVKDYYLLTGKHTPDDPCRVGG